MVPAPERGWPTLLVMGALRKGGKEMTVGICGEVLGWTNQEERTVKHAGTCRKEEGGGTGVARLSTTIEAGTASPTAAQKRGEIARNQKPPDRPTMGVPTAITIMGSRGVTNESGLGRRSGVTG